MRLLKPAERQQEEPTAFCCFSIAQLFDSYRNKAAISKSGEASGGRED